MEEALRCVSQYRHYKIEEEREKSSPFLYLPLAVSGEATITSYHEAVTLLQPPCRGDVDSLDLGRLSQASQLAFRELYVVVFQPGELLVLLLQHVPEGDATQAPHDQQANDNAEGDRVVFPLAVIVGEGGPDAGGVADAVHEGERRGALGGGAGDGVADPGVAGGVHGEDEIHEEQAEVAGAEAVGGHEDDAADDGDGDGVHEEPEPVAHAVRQPAVEEGVKDQKDVRGRDEQEGDNVAVAERRGEGGEEVLEPCGTRDAVVRDGEDVGFGVHECELHASDLAHATGFVHVGFGGVDGEATVRDTLHLRAQRTPCVGEIG